MVKNLNNGNNDLAIFIEYDEPNLEEILVKGRYLENTRHDCGGTDEEKKFFGHMHLYRKILGDYTPDTRQVILSKEGSRRLLTNLEEPDRAFTLEELSKDYWAVRDFSYKLF